MRTLARTAMIALLFAVVCVIAWVIVDPARPAAVQSADGSAGAPSGPTFGPAVDALSGAEAAPRRGGQQGANGPGARGPGGNAGSGLAALALALGKFAAVFAVVAGVMAFVGRLSGRTGRSAPAP